MPITMACWYRHRSWNCLRAEDLLRSCRPVAPSSARVADVSADCGCSNGYFKKTPIDCVLSRKKTNAVYTGLQQCAVRVCADLHGQVYANVCNTHPVTPSPDACFFMRTGYSSYIACMVSLVHFRLWRYAASYREISKLSGNMSQSPAS